MKHTSIRFRLTLLMILLAILPVVVLTLVATNNTRHSVEKEIVEANVSRMMWADQYLEELISQIDIMYYTLQIDEEVMEAMHDLNHTDKYIQAYAFNQTRDALTTAFYANSRKIDELTLYVHGIKKSVMVSFTSSGEKSDMDIAENQHWTRMLEGPINMYFKQVGEYIYAFHSINRFEDRKLLGGLSVQLNQDVWEEVSNILKSEEESAVYIVNDVGEVLSGSSQSQDYQEVKKQLEGLELNHIDVEHFSTSEHQFFVKEIADGQLIVVKTIPQSLIAESARPTIMTGILMGALLGVAAILLSVVVSFWISGPIIRLAKAMSQAQIQSFKSKPVRSRDEIGLLEQGYNSMMQRIRDLIEEEYQLEIEVKNSQLMALQAQINPHFLNNTLHLIGGMALSKNAPEIYDITRVMGDLLRYSISTEGTIVTLEEEIKHTQNYMFVQENRFVGRCDINYTIDESVLSSKIPKFSLQPVVENAFEHGLQHKEGIWRVDIIVKQLGNRVAVMVRDNGIGLSDERLDHIRMELSSDRLLNVKSDDNVPKKRKGIGLKNINARLKLHFGNRYGIRIYSRQGAGTLCVLVLPIEREEGEHV